MTTPPPAEFPPPAEVPPPAADVSTQAPATAPKRSKLPIVLAAVAGAMVLIAIAIGGTLWFVGRDDLTQEQAQRECRTAMEREADQRADRVGGASEGVLISVTGVELHDTWETDKGWSVNGTASITMTTALIGQTPTSVGLTCEAVATDDGVRTTVKNRL
ncbi:hypothetical protein FHX75_111254 [Micromonospora palomenae]|uniref:Uncharacterized protein n=1 Tax=Micromonospora palomenae TaxID=1461247 RepID=A0A561WW64_9ACTN|nr:hypothetical protein [Micromonospora palomenae]TWG28103.1 hypothetical protein FHX75_111254 [Micromonospora palomenae]